MSQPTSTSVRFLRRISPEQYGAMEAEVSFSTTILDGADVDSVSEYLLQTAATQVLVKLGMTPPPKVDPVAGSEPTEQQKPRRGRPPKNQEPSAGGAAQPASTESTASTAEAPASVPAEGAKSVEEPKPAADPADEFKDPPPAEPISDAKLQEECGKAAKVIGSDSVKKLFNNKYGAPRVSLVKAEERQAFLDDLANEVKKKQAS
ncbi:MAG: hypothetical protein AB7U76_24330 [Pirellulales bacterium]